MEKAFRRLVPQLAHYLAEFDFKNNIRRESPMTKAPTPTEKSQKQRDNTKTPPKLRLQNDCRLTTFTKMT